MISSLTSVAKSYSILIAMSLYDILFPDKYSSAALIGGGGKTSVMRNCFGLPAQNTPWRDYNPSGVPTFSFGEVTPGEEIIEVLKS